jgi:hypothetical protein
MPKINDEALLKERFAQGAFHLMSASLEAKKDHILRL